MSASEETQVPMVDDAPNEACLDGVGNETHTELHNSGAGDTEQKENGNEGRPDEGNDGHTRSEDTDHGDGNGTKRPNKKEGKKTKKPSSTSASSGAANKKGNGGAGKGANSKPLRRPAAAVDEEQPVLKRPSGAQEPVLKRPSGAQGNQPATKQVKVTQSNASVNPPTIDGRSSRNLPPIPAGK